MRKTTNLLITVLIFFISYLQAEVALPSIPTPYVNSVNIITGKSTPASSDIQYEYYTLGNNDVGDSIIQLTKGDFRIGRIKLQKTRVNNQSSRIIARFFYYPNYTEVLDDLNHKSLYRYQNSQITAVEHYFSPTPGLHNLYRRERLFWENTSSEPHLISRVLEDGEGQAYLCCTFQYEKQGQIFKETLTLFGNLSGTCQSPLLIQSSGYPERNGIESYSISYEYSPKDPDLILTQQEDNGLIIFYDYHPLTKQCLSKLIGNQEGIYARYFYAYDDQGFLNRTVMDDGCAKTIEDLTGVTNRQIIISQLKQENPALGQPLLSENRYLDLQTHTEVLLEKVAYTYSKNGELIQQDFYDSEGSLRYDLKMNYDDKGKLIKTIDSRGEMAVKPPEAFKYRYNDSKQRIGSIDTYGNETEYIYDDFGRLIKTILPSVLDDQDHLFRPILRQDYDINDHVIKSWDANGNKTEIQYNARGKPTKILYPDSSEESFIYNLDNSVKESIAKDGHRTIFERDALGRILHSEEQSANGEILNSLFYTYTGTQLISVTDHKSFKTFFQYDAAGRQIGSLYETKDGTKRLEWSYDKTGQKTKVKEWFGPHEQDFVTKNQEQNSWQQTIATHFEDAQGQVQKTIQPTQETIKSDFFFTQELNFLNDRGQYVHQQETVDGYGGREITTYDALKRVESIVKIDNFGVKLSESQFRYDGNGNQTLEKHLVLVHGQPIRTFSIGRTYDSLNRLTSIREGLESPQQKNTYYNYHTNGQIETIINPNGTTLFHLYDHAGRLSSFSASDQSFAYQYFYDLKGRLIRVEDLIHSSAITRTYNDLDQLIEEELNPKMILKNDYDLAGRRIRLTLPDQSSIAYEYEGLLLKTIKRLSTCQESVYQHDYYYDSQSGLLKSCQLIGHLGQVTYDRDYQERPIAIRSAWWSEIIPQTGFDAYQHLTQLSIQDLLGQINHHFDYTDDHQLSEESGYFNHHYQHDSLYNRLGYDKQPWIVNDLNQLIQTSNAEYHYDKNGCLSQKIDSQGCWQYDYDALNRLIRATRDQQEAIEYRYDAFHRRIAQYSYQWNSLESDWKLQDTHYFLYDGDKEVGKVDIKGNIIEMRVLGIGKGAEIGAAIALELPTGLYAPIHDHQGSIRCLISVQEKTVAEFYRYSAYGLEQIFDKECQKQEESLVGNPWRFSSKRLDKETGFIFFGKRYYAPELGRWMTPDPLFSYDTPNLYAFVKNTPLTHYDLYGLFSVNSIWNKVLDTVHKGFNYLFRISQQFHKTLHAELKMSKDISLMIEKVCDKLLGESMFLLMGYHFSESEYGVYGQNEISDKTRVTFINGILTTQSVLIDNVDLISKTHGGTNVHYIFRSTGGWMWDIYNGLLIKLGFVLGFRSRHAYLLANTWKSLINDMGGVDQGGMIIHYAHSLGGCDTDRARSLLTPEEQKMIRVISFGSATMIRNKGFQSVVNYVSINDGVTYLDPLGRARNLFDSNSNIMFKSQFKWFPLCDHFLGGETYKPILEFLGEQFILEYTPA